MNFAKFRLLMWKNFIIAKRHYIQAAIEIILPIILTIILAKARSAIQPTSYKEFHWNSFAPLPYSNCMTNGKYLSSIAIAPENNSAILGFVKDAFPTFQNITVLKDSDALETFLFNQSEFIAGIDFGDDNINSNVVPEVLKYNIRLPEENGQPWLTDTLWMINSLSKVPRDHYSSEGVQPPYFYKCFLTLQDAIDRTFIKLKSRNLKALPNVLFQRFPYPAVLEDQALTSALMIFPAFILISFIYSCKNIIKNVAIERETLMKETMKIMGLSSTLHWTAWFAKCFIFLGISFTVMTVLLTTGIMSDNKMAVFQYSNPMIIWLFFAIYVTSLITFCFLLSLIFKKSNTATNVGTLALFVTYLPYSYLADKFYNFGYWIKFLICMLPNAGMGNSIALLLNMESDETGVTFSNFFSRGSDFRFSFGEMMLAMIMGVAVNVLLIIYIEKVFPGEIGIPEKWYFPLVPCLKYFQKKLGYDSLRNSIEVEQDKNESNENFEEEPQQLKTGLRIKNLTKEFNKKLVVNNLNLNMFEDQITVLLGHNGAGKTTTMSMLTGMFPPTAGTAYVDGKDIRYDIDAIRSSLGLCPQHNVLFNELTVKEHFIFFSRLKGINNPNAINEEIKKYVKLLQLETKLNAQSHTLSGGMKRKLSIGIALCGGSKVVMCDEPTSGMDPAARRALWDLLIEEKKGRTILLTTHFMDEADILGDRIAIMAEGELKTVGSSFFLKKRFGAGYRLVCVKAARCQVDSIHELLLKYMPDVKMESNAQTEITFIISESHLPSFEEIFKSLEDNSERYGISSFGCSLTTLEEVFLKIGSDSYKEPEDDDGTHGDNGDVGFNELTKNVNGYALIIYQIFAMVLKKFHFQRRNYKSMIYYAIFTVWMIFVWMATPTIKFDKVTPLDISLSTYDNTVTVLETDGTNKPLATAYDDLFKGKDAVMNTVENIEHFILKKYNESLKTVNSEYLIGASITKDGIKAWFNYQPFHTVPLTLNTINRALLKLSAGDEHDIGITNKPYILQEEGSHHQSHQPISFDSIPVYVLLYFLMIYWPAVFIGFYIKERECRAKLLQMISGVNKVVYWLTSLIFDYLIFFVIIFAITSFIGFYQRPFFSSQDDLGQLFLILNVYALTVLPFIYFFSYAFTKFSTGESMVPMLGFLLVITYVLLQFVIVLSNNETYITLAKIFYWIGLFFPPFSYSDIFNKMRILGGFKIDMYEFNDTGIASNIYILVISAILYLLICLAIDFHLIGKLIQMVLNQLQRVPPVKDSSDPDVKAEADKINSLTDQEILQGKLVLKKMSKFYGKTLAVNQMSLGVEGSECFGLLGINAWFNGEFYHTMPLTLNTLHRAMLKQAKGNDYDIQLTNRPFFNKGNEVFSDVNRSHGIAGLFKIMIFLVFIMTYWPAVFIGFYIKERNCKAKLLQMISGVNKVTYWITSWIFDYFLFYLIIVAITIFMICFQLPFFSTMKEIMELFFIINVYAITILPFIYLFSYLFKSSTAGELMVPTLTILCTKITGIKLILYQMIAIVLKKFHYQRRNYKTILYYSLFTAWIIFMLRVTPDISKPKISPIDITLSSYGDTVTAYNESRMDVNSKYLIGATIETNVTTAWFNGEFYHTMPLTLNTLHRAMLKQAKGNDYDIQLTNRPFFNKGNEVFSDVHRNNGLEGLIKIMTFLVFIMTYWPAVFIGFYIKERNCKAKLLQMISGVNKVTYWITSWIFDYFIFYLIIVAITIFMLCFQLPFFSTMKDIMELFFIINVYAITILPFIYLFSYLFKSSTTGELMVPTLTILLFIAYLIDQAYLVGRYEENNVTLFAEGVYYIGLMFPVISFVDIFKKKFKNMKKLSGKMNYPS
ncbi:unnamed protein product [Diamesa tonsa]